MQPSVIVQHLVNQQMIEDEIYIGYTGEIVVRRSLTG